MQITHVDVTPMELPLRLPLRAAYHPRPVERVGAVFIRLETRDGLSAWGCAAFEPEQTGETLESVTRAWGCAAFEPEQTGETLESVTRACRACADRAHDLNPLATEYALAELAPLAAEAPSALCAFDIAFHDLLGLAAGLPLYRLLGGYRDRIQTSVTINVAPERETVELARDRARQGFRILKLKGGLNAEEDVRRVQAVHAALPGLTLRLDADQGYTIEQALAVARALTGMLEMLEQPIPAALGVEALRQVTVQSPVPILADQSVVGPDSALEVAGHRAAHGLSVKLATCGGLRCARQTEAIARAARLAVMVGCVNEPALLIAAGLAFALSSPGVRYGDLDGHLDLLGDPTRPRFILDEGWLIATDVPGLGCTVEL